MAGVIPPIFASSIILFPATLISWIGFFPGMSWLSSLASMLQRGQPMYLLFYALAILFFSYFYTGLIFNPREISDNLKKQGAFVPGIRPGEQTSKYLENVTFRLILIGALYILGICLLPEFLFFFWNNLPFSFGGTSLLIVVVVSMDLMEQIQTSLMSQQYASLMKKKSAGSTLLGKY
jgi:preprotein translocase subunit SecY